MLSLLKRGKLFPLNCRGSIFLFNLRLSLECTLLKIVQENFQKFGVNTEKLGMRKF